MAAAARAHAHPHRPPLTPAAAAHRKATLKDLHEGFRALRSPFAHLKAQLLQEYRRGGTTQLLRTYRHWYDRHVVAPRHALYQDALGRAAARRGAALARELKARYGDRFPFHDDTVAKAMVRVWTAPRGRTRWSYAQLRMPSDQVVQQRFTATLDEWTSRHRASLEARAARLTLLAHKDDPPPADGVPRIDPDRKRVAYPSADLGEEDLVDRVLDTVVVGRGQYFAEVGLRDIVREVDRAVSLIEGGRQPMIIGWRWVLSPAHDEKLCPSGICSALAVADVGHPHGGGVYFDALIPSEHPNGWCEVQAEWADEDEVSDPTWTAPEPPDDYEDRVRAIYDEHGATLIA